MSWLLRDADSDPHWRRSWILTCAAAGHPQNTPESQIKMVGDDFHFLLYTSYLQIFYNKLHNIFTIKVIFKIHFKCY